MTGLDWIIVGLLVLLGLFGFHRGFIVGVLSLAGFIAGAFVGTRIGPLLLPEGSASPYAPAFGLVGALLAGAILATGLEGVGVRVRRTLIVPGLSAFDGLLGAVFSIVVGLGVVWVAAAVVAQAPGVGSLRSAIQRSAILQALNQTLPPSGPILDALARLDPLPHIAGPSTSSLAPPEPAIAQSPAARAAARSVVRVLGTACGLAIEGSGWVAREDLVVTNAHVVAGETDTVVETDGVPPELPAQVVAFDKENDLALLRVPELNLPPLTLARNPVGGNLRGDSRLSRGRAIRRAARPHRRNAERDHRERIRRRAGDAAAHAPARPRTAGQLGRSGRGLRRRSAHDRLRGDDRQRAARRLRRREPNGRAAPRGARGAGRFDPLRRLAP